MGVGGWTAWLVIIAITLLILAMTTIDQYGPQEVKEISSADLMQINMQAKMILGQKAVYSTLLGGDAGKAPVVVEGDQDRSDGASPADEKSDTEAEVGGESEDDSTDELEPNAAAVGPPAMPEPKALDTGSYQQRLCYAIVLNESYGADRALKYMTELESRVAEAEYEMTEADRELRASVEAIFAARRDGDLTNTAITETQQQQLRDRLGYSGALLLTPAGGPDVVARSQLEQAATTSAFGMIGALFFAVLLLLFGVVALCVILGTVAGGYSPAQFEPWPSVVNRATGRAPASVYVETFAWWMLFFFGGQYLLAWFAILKTPVAGIIGNSVFFFVSLAALAWPIMRGVRLSHVLADIGWTGRQLFRNVLIGVATYAAWLPMVLASSVVVFALVLLFPTSVDPGEFEVPSSPSHPIQRILSSGDPVLWIGVFIAACVAAPIVEETMFRGVLYRHLRQVTGGSPHATRWGSVAISAVVNSVIFAAIHPQGILVIPLLATLAVGFSLAREWRNSLVSSITMHAMNNTMVTTLMFLIM